MVLNNPKSYNGIEFVELNPLFPFSALFRFRGWSRYLTACKEMDMARSVPMNSKWPHNTIFAILSSTYNGHRTSGTDPSGGKTGNKIPVVRSPFPQNGKTFSHITFILLDPK